MRNHYTPTRMATIKKTDINKCWGMENLEPSDIADGNVKQGSHFRNTLVIHENVTHRVAVRPGNFILMYVGITKEK